jgi:hypothetical protein
LATLMEWVHDPASSTKVQRLCLVQGSVAVAEIHADY